MKMKMKPDVDLLAFLAEAMAVGDVGQAIVNMEERGNQNLRNGADRLPKKIKQDGGEHVLERWGVQLGDDIDDLFRQAALPTGWTLGDNGHYWTDLVDGDGRIRASMFYKAAFYDRDAFLSLRCRYTYTSTRVEGTEKAWICRVMDGGKFPVWESEIVENYSDLDAQEERARQWLHENYPDHKSLLAYWD